MKKSIGLKLVLLNLVIVLVSIILISVPIITIQYNLQSSNAVASGENLISKANSDLNGMFQEPISMITTIKGYLNTHPINRNSIERFFGEALNDDKKYSELYFASALPYKDGGFFYSNDHWNPPSDYDQTTRAWFKAGSNATSFSVSDPYLDSVTKSMVAAFSTGIRQNGILTGVLAIDVQLGQLNDIVSPIKITPSGKSFLLDKNGKYVTNDDTSKLMNVDFFEEYGLSKYRNSISSEEVFFTDKTSSGMYFAGKKISEETGWILVTCGPRKELYVSVLRNILIIILLSVISLVVSAIIVLIVALRFVKPIKEVDKTINGIASGHADLTQRIKITTHDEIGSLVNGFNKFAEKLQAIIKDVKDSKGTLNNAGEDLSVSLSETSSSITEIIANIESMHNQISTQGDSVSQTAGAVNEIASNIESLEHMILNQTQEVNQASAAVEEMIGNISSVNSSVDLMANSFEELRANSQSGIDKQTAVNERIEKIENQSQMLEEANIAISNIAEQTNLLAMNAAIEAAHAGDAGKGFAVVADEIRKLSETSTTQSKTIGEQLTNIRESISEVVTASSEASVAFELVSKKLEDTDNLVMQIKAAMEEQNEGSKQITDALHNMQDSTVEVRSASTEMAEGNKAILEEVRNLQNATTVMRDSMDEMSIGAKKINETGMILSDVAHKMHDSITTIGNQIDQFEV